MEHHVKFKLNINGTKLSVNNSQLLISSGIPSLDEILGGGLAIGSVALIEEDMCGTYAKLMLQYFIAEGIVSEHSVFFGSQEFNSSSIITVLPQVIKRDENEEGNMKDKVEMEDLKIAWRYQNVPTTQTQTAKQFGHFYDLTKTLDDLYMDKADITCWAPSESISSPYTFTNRLYHDLLQSIKNKIDSGGFALKQNTKHRSVLRIALYGLGSPLWLPNISVPNSSQERDLDLFLFCLRALVRSAFATVLVTIPSKIIEEASVDRCIHSADVAMRLEPFSGSELENNQALSRYQGFFRILKIAAINSLTGKELGPVDFVFKLRRKKFTVEQLHLPPELQDSQGREQDEMPTMGCGSSTKHLLEF